MTEYQKHMLMWIVLFATSATIFLAMFQLQVSSQKKLGRILQPIHVAEIFASLQSVLWLLMILQNLEPMSDAELIELRLHPVNLLQQGIVFSVINIWCLVDLIKYRSYMKSHVVALYVGILMAFLHTSMWLLKILSVFFF